ncbi:condesin subunit E [Escherichia coli]|nr:condesin subunit E [Escherichia coli]
MHPDGFQEYLEEFTRVITLSLFAHQKGSSITPTFHHADPSFRLSELDMMVGKILCYLYLSPERLANEGIFTQQELYDELLTLADEAKLLKLVNTVQPVQTLTVRSCRRKYVLRSTAASFRHGVVYGPRQQQVSHYRIGVPLRSRCACWRRSP